MDTAHLETAFSMIRETTYQVSDDRAIGLFLFDNTIRNYVLPDLVNANQLKLLDTATTSPLHNIPASSNLAVGLERVLDSVTDKSGTEVVLFARGVIDTPTTDSRARFFEWLNVVLLPDAKEKNATVTLVTPAIGASTQILNLFNNSNQHKHVIFMPGKQAPLELINVLDIPQIPYGDTIVRSTQAGDPATPDNGDLQPTVDSKPIANPAMSNWIPIAKLVLLLLVLVLTVVLCAWFFWSRHRQASTQSNSTLSHSASSSYLPLTEKPSVQVDLWTASESGAEQTTLRVEPQSNRRDVPVTATNNLHQETNTDSISQRKPDDTQTRKTRLKSKTSDLSEKSLEEYPWD